MKRRIGKWEKEKETKNMDKQKKRFNLKRLEIKIIKT